MGILHVAYDHPGTTMPVVGDGMSVLILLQRGTPLCCAGPTGLSALWLDTSCPGRADGDNVSSGTFVRACDAKSVDADGKSVVVMLQPGTPLCCAGPTDSSTPWSDAICPGPLDGDSVLSLCRAP